jgi:putative transposase
VRLPGFDYCRSGVYFITFCTAHREPLLAEVIGDQLQLTAAGEIASDAMPHVLGRYTHARIIESVVMPDHVHVLLAFDLMAVRQKSVSRLIGAVKTHAAVGINRLRGTP